MKAMTLGSHKAEEKDHRHTGENSALSCPPWAEIAGKCFLVTCKYGSGQKQVGQSRQRKVIWYFQFL